MLIAYKREKQKYFKGCKELDKFQHLSKKEKKKKNLSKLQAEEEFTG